MYIHTYTYIQTWGNLSQNLHWQNLRRRCKFLHIYIYINTWMYFMRVSQVLQRISGMFCLWSRQVVYLCVMGIFIYTYIYIHMNAFMYRHIYVCLYLCMYECIYTGIYIQYTCVYMSYSCLYIQICWCCAGAWLMYSNRLVLCRGATQKYFWTKHGRRWTSAAINLVT